MTGQDLIEANPEVDFDAVGRCFVGTQNPGLPGTDDLRAHVTDLDRAVVSNQTAMDEADSSRRTSVSRAREVLRSP